MRTVLTTFAASAMMTLLAFSAVASAQLRFDKEPLTIVTASGARHEFSVELALDPGQREQGLMYRKQMAANEGMLFDFFEARAIQMWMRNTLIPLDMVFIDAKGTITHIHERAEPLSETIISSQGPVNYVLELNGGAAAQLGIHKGDKVWSKQIGNRP
ncbi:uncharacterized membrane protein (UPF0127 family) [Neorhizobium galegae]|uniref:DUF192 domain-containing protein n=1 Tax=Neorhizobium galegae TaxID=399 RepID=UPI001FD90621|nr:DUF192 domain-containing protein [Neorhizobium galegae]MBP2549149.1 uncharacterized membrane protein (UPF0127 family) [Neorhizobium galegae]